MATSDTVAFRPDVEEIIAEALSGVGSIRKPKQVTRLCLHGAA